MVLLLGTATVKLRRGPRQWKRIVDISDHGRLQTLMVQLRRIELSERHWHAQRPVIFMCFGCAWPLSLSQSSVPSWDREIIDL